MISVTEQARPELPITRPDTRVVLIYNPTSGSATSSSGFGIVPLLSSPLENKAHPPAWLEEAHAYIHAETGTEPEVIATQTQEDAIAAVRKAVSEGVSLVIAAGGDGTLRTVAQELAGTKTAMGILPKGTVNVFARELSIPLDDTRAALQICLHGNTRHVDLGCVDGGDCFLLMASIGIDAHAVENVSKEVKEVVGASAYVLSGLSTLANFTPPTVTLTIHGSDLLSGVPITRTSQPFAVLIMNAGLYGGDFRAAPDALLDDGLLDVFVFDAPIGLPAPLQRAAFAKQFGLAAIGQYAADPNIHYVKASRLEVTCDPETAVQVDGDSFGLQKTISIGIQQRALAVRC